jgi:TPR repeat protein
VPQDDSLAVQWYARAAGQGHALAQYNLGGMYNSGRGVEKDLLCGYMWLALAAEGGDSGAARAREAAAARLEPAQLQEAQQRMRQWHQVRFPPLPSSD